MSDDFAEITCTVAVESSNASQRQRTVYKNTKITVGRNEFRDLILKMDIKNQRNKFTINGETTTVHKRFLAEGKASLQFKDQGLSIFFSNCPPNKLSTFLKIICVKLTQKENIATPRTRLTSEKQRIFTEISPVMPQDKPKRPQPSPVTPVSSKRKGIYTNENVQPKRTKIMLYNDPAIALTRKQIYVLDLVKSGKNIFITGSAGTGKSYLLKKVIKVLPPDSTFTTASTALAACQIGGITLHSFAGIGAGNADFKQCAQMCARKSVSAQWLKCKHLIIDEISMVNGDYFELLEKIARYVRKNDKPFGGIQLIICGDFFQLPPVSRSDVKAKFCFQVNAWEKSGFFKVELTSVHRQSQAKFIDILQNIRQGRCTDEMTKILHNTMHQKIEQNDIAATRLCTHKKDSQLINQQQLDNLSNTVRTFTAIDSNESYTKFIENQCPAPRQIHLKIGSQIMLNKNLNLQKNLVNGARGIVTGFESGKEGLPIIKFMSGIEQVIKYERWPIKTPGNFILTREQLPLHLAWAISIHKSQGMTLDCVEMNLSNVFEAGQAYVALSRAKSLEGLRIIDFNPKCIRADPEVLRFYNNFTNHEMMVQRRINETF